MLVRIDERRQQPLGLRSGQRIEPAAQEDDQTRLMVSVVMSRAIGHEYFTIAPFSRRRGGFFEL